MFIKEIVLRLFRSHYNTKITGLGKFTVFLGPNGSGKSTILDAIGYALTGVCRGIDDRGAGADFLVTRPEFIKGPEGEARSFGVSLLTPKGAIVRGLGEGPKSKVQGTIGQKYGVDPILARALVQTASFTKLPPATQKQIVLSVAGSAVSSEEIHALLGPTAAQFAATSGPLDSVEAIDRADKELRAIRPEIKKDLGAIVIPEESEESKKAAQNIVDASAELASLRAHRDEALRKRAKHEADRKGSQNRLSMAKEILGRGLPVAPEGDAKKIEAEIEKIEAAKAAREKEYNALRGEVDVLTGRLEEAKRAYRSFAGLKGSCPTCSRVFTKADGEAVSKKLKDNGQKIKTELEPKQQRLETLAYNQESAAKLGGLRETLQAIHDYGKNLAYWKSSKADAEKEVKACEAELGKPEPAMPDVSEFDKEIAAGEEYIGKMRSLESLAATREQAVKQHHDLTVRLSNLEELIEKMGTKGTVRAKLMEGGGDDFMAEVNAIAQAVGLGKINIDLGAGFGIYVNGSPASLLSASEDYRLNLAFAAALAKRSGTGLLLLDAAEVLDGDNRGIVNAVLEKAGLEQAFLAATPEEMPRAVGEVSDWAVFGVEKVSGITKVRSIVESAVAA